MYKKYNKWYIDFNFCTLILVARWKELIRIHLFFVLGPCTDDEFKCDNGRCISDDVAFDFNDNCGDGSDQDNISKSITEHYEAPTFPAEGARKY